MNRKCKVSASAASNLLDDAFAALGVERGDSILQDALKPKLIVPMPALSPAAPSTLGKADNEPEGAAEGAAEDAAGSTRSAAGTDAERD